VTSRSIWTYGRRLKTKWEWRHRLEALRRSRTFLLLAGLDARRRGSTRGGSSWFCSRPSSRSGTRTGSRGSHD